MPPSLVVEVLGSLEVRRDGQIVPIGGSKPRAVLTLLGLYAGRVVPGETLLEVLWGADPPRTATKALQTHISALRRAVGERAILTKGSGWVLAGADTDAARFEAATTAARAAARSGDVAAAVAACAEAQDAWRGVPELPDSPRARAEVARWVELHETAAEDRIDALLARGDAAELVGELEAAVAAAPLRERRWAQLMLALYRAGRQADALAAYQRARALLDEQLGVQPGPELRKLETAVLSQDAGLAGPPRPAPPAPAERPPPSAAGALPALRTTFVGRAEELRRLDEALRTSGLVTVAGPGGVGKTRLAVAAAEAAAGRFGSRVVFVDLVPVSPGFVVQAVAAALGIAELPQQPLADAVRERLAAGRWLIVIDNCEHALQAVSEFVDNLTASCPGVVVLATSRERLGARGERIVAVPPLALASAETGGVLGSEAVTLFLDRASAIADEFEVSPAQAGEVCANLDGVPLAIELAAARCASLGIDGVLAGLEDRMRLLSGAHGATERHRSLRAVLDWSHDLLDDDERAVFRRAAVFSGGFDLAAAVAVAGGGWSQAAVADLIGRLTDKSLLVRHSGPTGSRWRLLQIVRVYARERLAAGGEEAIVAGKHLRWAAAVAARLKEQLVDDEPWLAEFDAVVDDLRAALGRAAPGDDPAYDLAMRLGDLAYGRNFLTEAREHYRTATVHASGHRAVDALLSAAAVAVTEMCHDEAYALLLEGAARSTDTGVRARALASAALVGSRFPGGFREAPSTDLLEAYIAQAEAASDGSPGVLARIAAAKAWTAEPKRAACDGPLGKVALELAEAAGDPVLISSALDGLTTVAFGEGRFRDAESLCLRRLELLDYLPRHDPRSGGEIVDIFHMATEAALAAGDLPGALAVASQAIADPLGRGVEIMATSRIALPHALCGAFADALGEATAMWVAWERSGRTGATWAAPAVYAAALASGLTGDTAGFRRWSQRALGLAGEEQVQGFGPFVECRVALHDGRLADALAIAQGLPPTYMGKFDAYARAIAADCAVVADAPDADERLAAVQPLAEQNDWAAACLVRARGRRHDDRSALDAAVARWEAIDAHFERACTLLLLPGRAAEGEDALAELGCPVPVAAS